jgi:tRNA-2-methylthio-N6-dimethylallyladenosine synthase
MAITTDIIVGFPGEVDEDYQRTRALAHRVGFDNAFVFKYSKRNGTPAAELEDQCSNEIKESRNQDLLEVINHWAKIRGNAFVDQTVEILCEGPSKTNRDRLMGRTRGNKIVVFDGTPRQIGQLLPVRVTRSTGFTLFGDPQIFTD